MKQTKFSVKKGPIFANFVLADEINRAPAKVQSALLEAMQEKQVTIGDESFILDKPFLVMATGLANFANPVWVKPSPKTLTLWPLDSKPATTVGSNSGPTSVVGELQSTLGASIAA